MYSWLDLHIATLKSLLLIKSVTLNLLARKGQTNSLYVGRHLILIEMLSDGRSFEVTDWRFLGIGSRTLLEKYDDTRFQLN